MSTLSPLPRTRSPAGGLPAGFDRVRARTRQLVAPLSAEDACVQSMPDASPAKWHLAHTTWFFEAFVLERHDPDYRPFDDRFSYLFNSYYFTVGQMHARPRRGLLTRPSLAEVLAYRDYVEEAVRRLMAEGAGDEEIASRVTLGLHHEEQHQELVLTDIKHLLAQNPMAPAYAELPGASGSDPGPMGWVPREGGAVRIGHDGNGFAFDNETPRHRTLLNDHELGSRLVTNGEYREFIDDGGYRKPELWLSDGWTMANREGWKRPLYWMEDLDQEFTLAGTGPIDPHAPVTHVSYYEADAFARWAGARLPTEAEWESAAAELPVEGNFADSGHLKPRASGGGAGLAQVYGDTWEWTASPYAPYPGFRPLAGSLGEYNGKFMCSQLVLRGGSCATPAGHVRPSYRNFFYPHQRWQFSGIRLARDAAG
jgi:ergothioneine biosynthesis protein EgtB